MGNAPIVPTVPPPPGGGGGWGLIEAGDVFHIFHSVPLGQGKNFSTKKKRKKKIGQNYHLSVWATLSMNKSFGYGSLDFPGGNNI